MTPLHLTCVSYEYPPHTSGGKIATSFYSTAQVCAERGHRVEVFAGSPHRTESAVEDRHRRVITALAAPFRTTCERQLPPA